MKAPTLLERESHNQPSEYGVAVYLATTDVHQHGKWEMLDEMCEKRAATCWT